MTDIPQLSNTLSVLNMFSARNLLVLVTGFTSVFSSPLQSRQSSLDTFLASENTRARQDVLDNIGSAGVKVQGASSGVVVASPSKTNPDCMRPSQCVTSY